MSEEKKYQSFSITDIEKYHSGQLSAKEMHDMEKAALDDPFLSDAMEGYATSGININADIEDLKNRLAAKQQSGKVVPITGGRKSNSTWLRAAVMIIAIAGAGLLIYQFAFNTQSDKNIAKTEPKVAEEIKAVCDYISPKKGGEGCARDVIEKVMKIRNDWYDEAPSADDGSLK